ncbi:phosphomannomutase/phosphoglucomutase [Methylohalomonas lacus]|uniref:phosphomannomutase n=1 Tax=Methylohalomonas lacus TaxID=398773 RepID=A0AAE3HJ10_9GAMM|nr:phosphomannomutase/phosphoglucomutase [Methylohalomonas lacus]MCS3903274.1 phosphomannomutase/phosphoglucomutase [Methylohalomonas lacus]
MEGPIKRRRIRRRTLRNAIVAAMGLIVGVVGWYVLQSHLDRRAAAQHAATVARAEQVADTVAAKVTERLARVGKQLETLAASAAIRQVLTTAATHSDPETVLAAAAADHAAAIDGLLRVRLLLPDAIERQPDSESPLSYASLDMLKQARQSDDPVAAELHMPGTERAHIVMTRQVTDSAGDLLGLLHASLEPGLLPQAVGALEGVPGYLEIKQFVPGAKPVVLLQQGDPAFKQNFVSITRPIPASTWTVSYWPPPSGSTSLLPAINASLVIIAAGAGVFVLLVVLLWRRGKRTDNDSTISYGGAVQAFIDGAHPSLGKLIPNLPRPTQKKQSQQPMKKDTSETSAAAEREDITRVVKAEAAVAEVAEAAQAAQVPAGIFRAYDIRGLVETELTPAVVEQLGRALGSEVRARNLKGMVVGRDGRLTSPDLAAALSRGLRAAGVDVTDIGLVATPVLYFATHFLEPNSGVMITGSHNGPEYNGLKMVLGGETLSGDTVQALYQRIQAQDFSSGAGDLQMANITADYIRRATEDIPVALGNALKIVVDCGNGAAAKIAPQVYRALGHEVIELYCDIDGNFPNHHPDPSQPENMQDLIARVKETGADLGFAFDGDGDRLGVVDADGNIIWPDRQLMLLARDVLSRNPGASIIFDVKCSRYLKAIIESAGGQPLMWKTGHSLIKAKMKEVNAPLAGEMSGHIFFKERWYGFDDAIYTAARLLEILVRHADTPTAVLAELPDAISTHELRVPLPETRHAEVMQALKDQLAAESGELNDVDGLRIDYSDGWGLIRPSNTSPFLVTRFEAENQPALERIQAVFRNALQAVDPALEVPF